MKKNVSFVERVMARLNMTEDQRVLSFYEKNRKFHEKQIQNAKEAIEDLKEQLAEKQENLMSVIESPDQSSIKTNESQRSYLAAYNKAVTDAMNEVAQVEADIESHEELVSNLRKRWKAISGE